MRRTMVALAVVVALAVGVFAGRGLSATQEPAPNYMVVSDFELGPDMSFNEGIARLSEWIQLARATGKHESVRLFMHDWGPKTALYMVVETDWNGVGAIFPDLVEAKPEMMDEKWGFAGHGDDIMTEIPVP